MAKIRVTPEQLDLWSSNLSDLYQSLEGDIIRLLIKRLNRGSSDITQWQAEKLQELRLFNRDVVRLLSQVTKVAEPEIERMFQSTGKEIVRDVDDVMPYDTQPMPSDLDNIMRGYYEQSWSDIDNLVNQTLVTTQYGRGTAERAYTQVLNQVSASFNTGIYTFEQSVERAVTQLAQKGIDSMFIDKGGNPWSLERYTRTVLKSTLGNTYDTIRKDRMADYDVHTVIVTSHAGAREKCSIIQGNVVDLRFPEEIPADSKYRSIYDPYWQADYETAGGHRGINCHHLHVPFVPGVNTNNQPEFDEKLNAKVAKDRDTQRRIEREIVKYKKNLMVSEEMGSENASYWKQMVSRRQKAMRDHLKENGEYLSRNYKREKVYTPLNVLMKDFNYKN